MKWDLRCVHDADKTRDKIRELLYDGWEPFAVDNGWMYFRRPEPISVNVKLEQKLERVQ